MKYIAAAQHGPAANFPIVRIVMHGTVGPCAPGAALGVAKMFQHCPPSDPKSTQYVVDPATTIQCVKDNVVAYGAPPNAGAIHVEQCDPQAGPVSRWQDAAHQAMLRRAAVLVASLCKKYNIPVVKLNYLDLRAGKKGICGHEDVSLAWHQTTHVDPGAGYPWAQLFSLVNAQLHPTPAPTALPEGKMYLIINDGQEHTFLTDMVTKRWIKSNAELAYVRYNLEHHAGYTATQLQNYVVPIDQVAYFGVTIGDDPYFPVRPTGGSTAPAVAA